MSLVNVAEPGDPLVTDERLERVFYKLQSLRDFPDGIEFATKRQEPIEDIGDGRRQGAVAVFIVTSPHPSRGRGRVLSARKLISVASMPYERWLDAERTYRHYAGMTDPLRPIFAGLLRQHLTKRENLEAIDASR